MALGRDVTSIKGGPGESDPNISVSALQSLLNSGKSTEVVSSQLPGSMYILCSWSRGGSSGSSEREAMSGHLPLPFHFIPVYLDPASHLTEDLGRLG